MAKTPQEILEELRKNDPQIAAAMAAKANEQVSDSDKQFEQYIGMCANASSILAVISFHEAKAPEEREDARKSGAIIHGLVSATHELICSMPPNIRVAAIENILSIFNAFMEQNEKKFSDEIVKAHAQRDAMLARLAAERAPVPS